jgi:hypothetical protein
MAEDETTAPPSPPAAALAPPAWITTLLHQRLSTLQTLVGILAGILTIGGTFVSYSGLTASAAPPHQGDLVASVLDARSRKPVLEASVEILTPEDALVTTLSVDSDGLLTRRLKEGRYRLRVTHPAYTTEVRRVEVHAGQRSDIRLALALRPPPPRVVKDVTVTQAPGPVHKFFKDVFGQ